MRRPSTQVKPARPRVKERAIRYAQIFQASWTEGLPRYTCLQQIHPGPVSGANLIFEDFDIVVRDEGGQLRPGFVALPVSVCAGKLGA